MKNPVQPSFDTLLAVEMHLCHCIAELSNEKHGWRRQEYAKTFDLSLTRVKENVERIDARKIKPDEFIEKYEKNYVPVVITNMLNKWPAMQKWTKEVSL